MRPEIIFWEYKSAFLMLKGNEIAISLSMGMTVFPEDSSSPEDLLSHADEAMYSAKKSSSGRYAFYQIEKSINA